MALKLAAMRNQLKKGPSDMLVLDGTVHGSKVMPLIMAWMACNQDIDESMIVARGGQGHGGDLESSDEVDPFMLFVVKQGVPVLLELIEVTYILQIWSLFALACKTMANLIKDKDVADVRGLLQLNNGVRPSTSWFNGLLKFLPISQRRDLF